jgi:hypothetical protein
MRDHKELDQAAPQDALPLVATSFSSGLQPFGPEGLSRPGQPSPLRLGLPTNGPEQAAAAKKA